MKSQPKPEQVSVLLPLAARLILLTAAATPLDADGDSRRRQLAIERAAATVRARWPQYFNTKEQ